MKKVLLGVSGGIAAYKIPELARLLVKEGCAVKTILTEPASRFCSREALAALTGNSVHTGIFDPVFLEEGHTELAKWADVFIVAPATANTIAKLALGVADNLLTTTFLASPAKKLIAPSMNTEMYDADALQKNIKLLEDRGAEVLPPDVGDLACRTYGAGRLPDPYVIVEAAYRAAGSGSLRGKHVVVSAGATVESIDDVRVITNRSSGKMGAALARAAYRMGATVTLILGRSEVCPIPPVEIVRAESVESFSAAYRRFLPKADYFVAAAAIGDFSPSSKQKGKIKRTKSGLTLDLKPTPDLLADLSKNRHAGGKVLGFALESELDEKSAKSKLAEKHLDAIFLNSIRALGADDNAGVGLPARGSRRVFTRSPKLVLAAELLEWLAGLP